MPYRGPVANIIHQLVGGLRAAMGYTGNADLRAMQTRLPLPARVARRLAREPRPRRRDHPRGAELPQRDSGLLSLQRLRRRGRAAPRHWRGSRARAARRGRWPPGPPRPPRSSKRSSAEVSTSRSPPPRSSSSSQPGPGGASRTSAAAARRDRARPDGAGRRRQRDPVGASTTRACCRRQVCDQEAHEQRDQRDEPERDRPGRRHGDQRQRGEGQPGPATKVVGEQRQPAIGQLYLRRRSIRVRLCWRRQGIRRSTLTFGQSLGLPAWRCLAHVTLQRAHLYATQAQRFAGLWADSHFEGCAIVTLARPSCA